MLSKTQLHKIRQWRRLFSRLLGLLLRTGLSLAKSTLIPLGLVASEASAMDAAIQKNVFRSG